MSARERLGLVLDQLTVPAAALSNDQLLQRIDLVGEATRLVAAIGVETIVEVSNRRSGVDGRSLSAALAHKSPADVVAARARIPLSEAHSWARVGAAVESEVNLQGESLPPAYPAVADAISSGTITIGDAEAVITAVTESRPFIAADAVGALEASLVGQVHEFSRREFQKLCRRTPEQLMPEGVEFREAMQRARSGLRITQLSDGMTRMVAMMHPEAAGFVLTALDARTAPRRQPSFLDGDREADGDPRSLDEQRLDALVGMSRDSIAADPGQIAGTAVTMSITMTLDELKTGLGSARIAGVDETISAATARRLAADAEIIPCVLGGPSAILDQGRSYRLFTDAQRRAIAVRDQGCVWPGCTAPPAWCELAHLLSWLDGGSTDLDNGVLLCPFHHRCFDNDDWLLEWREGELWLIPPPHLDAARTPRRAGRRGLVH